MSICACLNEHTLSLLKGSWEKEVNHERELQKVLFQHKGSIT